MEKKTKILQLRKETIAVLNGERMSHVVGGNGQDLCIYEGKYYQPTDVIVPGCFCNKDGQVQCEGDTGLENEAKWETFCDKDTCTTVQPPNTSGFQSCINPNC